jgi:hypothetical protein
LWGQGLEGPGDEDLCRVIDKMDASAFTAASAAAADPTMTKTTKMNPQTSPPSRYCITLVLFLLSVDANALF